jgi:PAS domain S-box-containing protein
VPYKAYFESASESLIIVDLGGFIVETNPQTKRLFGYSADELIGQPIEVLLPERLRERHRAHRDGFLLAPHSRPMGVRLNVVGRRKDGSEFPIEVRLTYARDASGPELVVATVADISERLALEQQARRADTLSSLGTAAAGIAHDLRNPLTVILSRVELLRGMPPEALRREQVEEDLAVIHRQAERAIRIVREFLELSHHGSKTSATVDVNDVVGRALLLFGEQMRKDGIRVMTNLDRSVDPVLGDAIALERVLINLLANACDAMAGGGTLTIATGAVRDHQGWLRLSVRDTGTGIDPQALAKIFDLMYTTKPGGSGLGLWLSQRIMQEHNGRIDVDSEVGRGTTFTLHLPGIKAPASG